MDWYLIIPWILGIAAWLFAARRRMQHPLWQGLALFLVGCGIVVLFDLGVL
jgi:hypothetical protein